RLLTCYSPVRHSSTQSKLRASAFDLHVLSTQPAFVLSQDQTLHKKNYLCCSMNPSKTANPTTGVIEAGQIQCLTRKTKHFWHHKLVQTNTLLDSQTTNTHPSPQPKKSHVHWGHPFHYRHPTPEPTEPNSHPSWSDPVETLSRGPRSRRGNEI